MVRIAHIEFLYALFIIPVLILIYIYLQKNHKKILEKFADTKLHNILFPLKSNLKAHVKFALFTFSLFLILIALANPQVGTKIEEAKQIGIDIYILLDVSKSMLAEDIKPSRLEKAKYEISKLIQRLKGDRIGLIVFAGEAYVQIPLTSDYSAANLFLSAVDVNSVSQPGTAIGSAITLALKSFKYDDGTKKAIIIITDGEDHQGDLENVLDEANSKDVAIYAIGFGSPAGSPIPVYDENGNQIGYKKDRQGNIVITKLNQEILKEITSKCNGKYYLSTNTGDELEKIYNDLANIEKTEYGARRVVEYEDRFYYFLFPAILLLIIDFFISSNKSSWLVNIEKLRGGQK